MEEYIWTDEDIKELKKQAKGTKRHDKELTERINAANISKFDIIMPEEVTLPTSVYNQLKEHQRKEDIQECRRTLPGGRKGGGKSKGKGKGRNKSKIRF